MATWRGRKWCDFSCNTQVGRCFCERSTVLSLVSSSNVLEGRGGEPPPPPHCMRRCCCWRRGAPQEKPNPAGTVDSVGRFYGFPHPGQAGAPLTAGPRRCHRHHISIANKTTSPRKRESRRCHGVGSFQDDAFPEASTNAEVCGTHTGDSAGCSSNQQQQRDALLLSCRR